MNKTTIYVSIAGGVLLITGGYLYWRKHKSAGDAGTTSGGGIGGGSFIEKMTRAGSAPATTTVMPVLVAPISHYPTVPHPSAPTTPTRPPVQITPTPTPKPITPAPAPVPAPVPGGGASKPLAPVTTQRSEYSLVLNMAGDYESAQSDIL